MYSAANVIKLGFLHTCNTPLHLSAQAGNTSSELCCRLFT